MHAVVFNRCVHPVITWAPCALLSACIKLLGHLCSLHTGDAMHCPLCLVQMPRAPGAAVDAGMAQSPHDSLRPLWHVCVRISHTPTCSLPLPACLQTAAATTATTAAMPPRAKTTSPPQPYHDGHLADRRSLQRCCMVPGCTTDLASCSAYNKRLRICREHQLAPTIAIGDTLQVRRGGGLVM